MRRARRCAIVGGGMLGIGLALNLTRSAKRSVTIFEAAPHLGGLAAPWEMAGVRWDKHYHVILPSDRHLLALLHDIGLENELRWSRARSAFYIDGNLYPFTTSIDFLRFPLGIRDKLRLRDTIAQARCLPPDGAWRQLSIEQWLRTAGGDRLFERVWRPLLRAKLGNDYDGVSASFIVATIKRLQSNDSSRLRGKFGYVRGGYATIIDRLALVLSELGIRIRYGAPVRRIEQTGGSLTTETLFGREEFDEVIVTIPPPIATGLCPSLADSERERWARVRYRGIICSSLLLDRPLGNAYVTNLADDKLPFTGIIEMTNLVHPGTFGGRHLVYLPRYLAADDPYTRRTNEEISADIFSALGTVFPRFDPVDIRAFRVSRVPYVFALPECSPERDLRNFHTSIPNLYLACSAQIAEGTLNVNETLALAARAAATIETGSDGTRVSAA